MRMLRAICATHSAFGCALAPRIFTRRVATSTKKRMKPGFPR
jgi:hypothetical protein